MTEMNFHPLQKGEVRKAVRRECPSRIPMVEATWWGEGLVRQYGAALNEVEQFSDVEFMGISPINYNEMGLSWKLPENTSHDAAAVLDDWSKLDEFIEKLPTPEDFFRRKPEKHKECRQVAKRAESDDRYLMYRQWRLFYERPWQIRGMENLMTDYYLFPEKVHKLNQALADMYIEFIRHVHNDFGPDGFWTSDDLGHQTQLMIPLEVFQEFLKPYYAQVGKVLKQLDMDWWLHSCGNNTQVMNDLVEAGVDIFHPVQKDTMDEVSVAREFGDKLSFLAGIDVQHVLQEKTADGVREEVRFLIDTFDRPDGGMCIAAGNGIVSGTPIENIAAFLDEAYRYGASHRRTFEGQTK